MKAERHNDGIGKRAQHECIKASDTLFSNIHTTLLVMAFDSANMSDADAIDVEVDATLARRVLC